MIDSPFTVSTNHQSCSTNSEQRNQPVLTRPNLSLARSITLPWDLQGVEPSISSLRSQNWSLSVWLVGAPSTEVRKCELSLGTWFYKETHDTLCPVLCVLTWEWYRYLENKQNSFASASHENWSCVRTILPVGTLVCITIVEQTILKTPSCILYVSI